MAATSPKPVLLGLVGPKGVGKDTSADYLVEKYSFTKVAFADPLKKCCQTLFDLPDNYFNEQALKETSVEPWGISPRKMMQTFGTDMVRSHLGDDFWLRHMEKRLNGDLTTCNVVVTDIRFRNEAEFVRARGGYLVRVVKTPNDCSVDQHPSEQEQKNIVTQYAVTNPWTNDPARVGLRYNLDELLSVVRGDVLDSVV